MRLIGRLTLVLGVLAMLATPAIAGDWQKLGTKALVFDSEQATIEVGNSDQTCSEVKLKVSSKGVKIHDMTIAFADGTTQKVDGEFSLLPGDESTAIAINGGAKSIQRVEFTYSPLNGQMNGRTRITLVGAA